jgi:hypothetical protein
MDLPGDLTDRLRDAVRRSLLPEAEMPGDAEGLYGRVDPEKMDRELERLGRTLFTYVPHMNAPFRRREPPGPMKSLQLLASLWSRAEIARRLAARDFDNPTVRSLESSIRRGTYIMSHVPGHEVRYPPWPKRRAYIEIVGILLVFPIAFAVFIPVVDAVSIVRPDAPALWVRILKSMLIGSIVGLLLLLFVLAPSLPAILKVDGQAKDI